MKRATNLAAILLAAFGFASIAAAQTTVTVIGESWDADSRGFAYIQGLSVKAGTEKASRRGSRISVDGQPDKFATSGVGGAFEFTFTTSEPTFRLIVEGDRFPPTITQSYDVPEGGGEMEIGRVYSPRLEGPEHTWPMPMVATALGYDTPYEMLADNNAAIRVLILGSGTDGAPDLTDNATLTFPNAAAVSSSPEPTTNSPFLRRIPQPQYVIPFDMNKQDTFFYQQTGPNLGAFVVVIPFEAGEAADKDVVIQITDTVTDELLEPPRPWHFEPIIVSVRNGFATDIRPGPDIE